LLSFSVVLQGLASALDVEDFEVDTDPHVDRYRDSAEHRPSLQRATDHITPKLSASKPTRYSTGEASSGQGPKEDEEVSGASDNDEEADKNNSYAKYATAFSSDASDVFDEDRELSARFALLSHITVATEIPFEYQSFEAIFETVITIFNQEFVNIAAKLRLTLHKIKDASLLSLHTQEKMASLKSRVALLLAKVIAHRKMLEEAMNDEEVMALMNLSRLRVDPGLYMCV
jgi:hypothetical protein